MKNGCISIFLSICICMCIRTLHYITVQCIAHQCNALQCTAVHYMTLHTHTTLQYHLCVYLERADTLTSCRQMLWERSIAILMHVSLSALVWPLVVGKFSRCEASARLQGANPCCMGAPFRGSGGCDDVMTKLPAPMELGCKISRLQERDQTTEELEKLRQDCGCAERDGGS